MRVLAVIPARMGSKRLPRKNLLEIEPGVSLVQHAMDCAAFSGVVADVYALTDEPEALAGVRHGGVLMEPLHLAGDMADIAAAVAYATQHLEREHGLSYDYVATLQPAVLARSPLIVRRVIEAAIAEGAGGAVTAARTVPWLWEVDARSHEARNAWYPGPYPRSQYAAPRLAEINAVQVASRDAVRMGKRWSLPLLLAELPPWAAALDIDHPHDLALARDFWPWARPRLETHEPAIYRADAINGDAA